MDWDLVLSIIVAVAAILALGLTVWQIRISNKQHLFDIRIENYLIVKGLILLYLSNNKIIFDRKKENEFMSDAIFRVDLFLIMLAHHSYFENVALVMETPLPQPSKELFMKIEELATVAQKLTFAFLGEAAAMISDFVKRYQEFLLSICHYQIIIKCMTQEKTDIINEAESLRIFMDDEAYQAYWQNTVMPRIEQRVEEDLISFREQKQREKLYAAMDRLKDSYELLDRENVIEKIERQIKLR